MVCAISIAVALSVQAQLAVGAHGLPVLCTIAKEEREDNDMLRAALECLTIAIGNPTQHTESAGKVPQFDDEPNPFPASSHGHQNWRSPRMM